MTDLRKMVDDVSLTRCKEEIDCQFAEASCSGSAMKLAVMMQFIIEDALNVLRNIDGDRFVSQLSDELKAVRESATDWGERLEMLKEHLEKNRELLMNFDSDKLRVVEITDRISDGLKDYDEMLRGLGNARESKPL